MEDDKKKKKETEEDDKRGYRHSWDLQRQLTVQLNQQTSKVASVQFFAS